MLVTRQLAVWADRHWVEFQQDLAVAHSLFWSFSEIWFAWLARQVRAGIGNFEALPTEHRPASVDKLNRQAPRLADFAVGSVPVSSQPGY